MTACLVGTIRVIDAAAWRYCVGRVGPTFAPYGGTVLFRGSKAQPLSGSAHGDRIVAAAFPDMEALRAWHASPAYRALRPTACRSGVAAAPAGHMRPAAATARRRPAPATNRPAA